MSIPKIIHYCWFGKGPISDLEKHCIDSWQLYCPDYKIMIWDESSFDINYCKFTEIAYSQKKYAFVSDVARLYALSSVGGIYMDTDMLLLGYLPHEFLEFNFFLGKETSSVFSAGIIGSAKGNLIVEKILSSYVNCHTFDFEDILIPRVITGELLHFEEDIDFHSFSPDYFYPLPYKLRQFHYKQFLTSNSIAVHLWNLSWRKSPSISKTQKFISFIKYWISYFYIPSSFKRYTDDIFFGN